MFTLVCNFVNKFIELFYLKFDLLGILAYSDSFPKRSGKFGFFCGNIDASVPTYEEKIESPPPPPPPKKNICFIVLYSCLEKGL